MTVRGTSAPLEDYEDLVEADNRTFAETNLFSDSESRGVFGDLSRSRVGCVGIGAPVGAFLSTFMILQPL